MIFVFISCTISSTYDPISFVQCSLYTQFTQTTFSCVREINRLDECMMGCYDRRVVTFVLTGRYGYKSLTNHFVRHSLNSYIKMLFFSISHYKDIVLYSLLYSEGEKKEIFFIVFYYYYCYICR